VGVHAPRGHTIVDVEMDVTQALPGDHVALQNAAIWLRQHLNLHPQQTIFEQFEKHFNCRIEVDDRTDSWMQPNLVTFKNSAVLTEFLLRWT
jgi:hypothetical protein